MEENEEIEFSEPSEMSEEKAKRIKDKMEAFMADISNELLDDEDYKKVTKKIFNSLKRAELPATLTYLKAMREGYNLCMGAHGFDKGVAMMILTCMSRLVAEKETDMELKVSKSMNNKK